MVFPSLAKALHGGFQPIRRCRFTHLELPPKLQSLELQRQCRYLKNIMDQFKDCRDELSRQLNR
jgi:methylphosphotriester-DNA--protein-cysteine methyltransferase